MSIKLNKITFEHLIDCIQLFFRSFFDRADDLFTWALFAQCTTIFQIESTFLKLKYSICF